MTTSYHSLFVVNPHSANGSTGRQWPQIEARLREKLSRFDVVFTGGMGDATRLVRERGGDYEMVVAVGGDGTNNEVINGLFDGDERLHKHLVFGFICRGTGGDFRKTFGWSTDLDESIERLCGQNTQAMDLGRIRHIDRDGQQTTRYFLNIASFGLGGLVDEYCNQSSKALGGKLSFMMASAKALLAYQNRSITLRIDDEREMSVKAKNVAICNGRFFGGGMHVGPTAKVDDGLFDVTILGDMSRVGMLLASRQLYADSILSHPKVEHFQCKSLEAEADAPVYLDVDGEAPGRLPARFEILPGELSLKMP